jgi:hypothetical protein
MRTKKVYDKKLETVSLPPKLVNFLKKTYQSILNKEEATLLESDDLLQDSFVYGGLLKQGGNEYSFVYFPDVSGIKNKWEFKLTTQDLKSIADETTTTLDLWACTQDNCQSKFMNNEDTCFYHDYFDDGKPYPNQKSPEEIAQIEKETQELMDKMGIRPFRD